MCAPYSLLDLRPVQVVFLPLPLCMSSGDRHQQPSALGTKRVRSRMNGFTDLLLLWEKTCLSWLEETKGNHVSVMFTSSFWSLTDFLISSFFHTLCTCFPDGDLASFTATLLQPMIVPALSCFSCLRFSESLVKKKKKGITADQLRKHQFQFSNYQFFIIKFLLLILIYLTKNVRKAHSKFWSTNIDIPQIPPFHSLLEFSHFIYLFSFPCSQVPSSKLQTMFSCSRRPNNICKQALVVRMVYDMWRVFTHSWAVLWAWWAAAFTGLLNCVFTQACITII